MATDLELVLKIVNENKKDKYNMSGSLSEEELKRFDELTGVDRGIWTYMYDYGKIPKHIPSSDRYKGHRPEDQVYHKNKNLKYVTDNTPHISADAKRRIANYEHKIKELRKKNTPIILIFLLFFIWGMAGFIMTNGEGVMLYLIPFLTCFLFAIPLLDYNGQIGKYRKYIELAKEDKDGEEIMREVRAIAQYLKDSENQGPAPWDTHYLQHPCPYCGKKKVRYAKWQDKQMSAAFWGFYSRKLHSSYKCDNCKRMWN